MVFEPARQQRNAESGMVNIGVAADKDNVKLIPAPLLQIFLCRGNKWHRSGEQRQSFQSHRFRKSADQIHILHRLAGSALYEVVDS